MLYQPQGAVFFSIHLLDFACFRPWVGLQGGSWFGHGRVGERTALDAAGWWVGAQYTLRGLELLPRVPLPRARLGYPCKVHSQGGAICSLEGTDILFSWRSPAPLSLPLPRPWPSAKFQLLTEAEVILLPSLLSPAWSGPLASPGTRSVSRLFPWPTLLSHICPQAPGADLPKEAYLLPRL